MNFCVKACVVLGLTQVFCQACSNEPLSFVEANGIKIERLSRDNEGVSFYINSINSEYDCINVNGVNGDGEDAEYDGMEHLTLSPIELGGSDIVYFDNKPDYKLVNLSHSFKFVRLIGKYNYVSFPIFDCEKFGNNEKQKVYIYISRRL